MMESTSKLPEVWDAFIKRTEKEAQMALKSKSEHIDKPEVLPGVQQLLELLAQEVFVNINHLITLINFAFL